MLTDFALRKTTGWIRRSSYLAVAVCLFQVATVQAQSYSVIDLGDLPGGSDGSFAQGINNSGQVVGYSTATTGTRAFLYSNGVMTNLGDLPGGSDLSVAQGINNAGQVVGYSYATTGARAFLYSNGTMTNLGDLPGGSDVSLAYGINNSGQVVGYSGATTGTRAFLYGNGVMTDINSLIDPTSPLALYVTLTEALAINDSGWIAANGTDSRTGATHAYLLSSAPVPLPAGVWLLLSGLCGIGVMGEKRFSRKVLARS